MTETPRETPVERRLREMAAQIRYDHANEDSIGAADIDAGREAIKLLREVMVEHDSEDDFDPVASDALEKRVRALLARCEETR